MTAVHTLIADAIETALTGAPDVGKVIRGGLEVVPENLSSDAATVCIEYGALEPIDGKDGQLIAGYFDGRLDVSVDIYWAGPPSVWESRLWECWAAVWRAVSGASYPASVLRARPFGHDEPERNVDGDNQHVCVRNRFRFDVRYSIGDPEA